MSSAKKEPVDNQDAEEISAAEADRLRRDMLRPDMEKFKLFTAMLRLNALLKRAKITHK